MRDRAVRRLAGELDHLLAGERRFADDRLRVALLAELAKRARRLFLVRVDEQRVAVRLLRLEDRGREVDLAGIGRDVGADLDALGLERLDDHVAAALAEVVVDPHHVDGPRLEAVLDVARDLRHRRGLREGRAEDVGIALLRDRGGLAPREVRNLGAPRLLHAHEDRAGEHRAHHDVGAVVDGLLGERLGDAGIRLRVARRVLDLPAEDAACGVDLLDGELRAVVEVRAGRGAGAGKLDQSDDLDRGLGERRRREQRERGDGEQAGNADHDGLLLLAMMGTADCAGRWGPGDSRDPELSVSAPPGSLRPVR